MRPLSPTLRRFHAANLLARAWRAYGSRTECRICMSPGAHRVCGCTALAHDRCLAAWMRQSGSARCELCRSDFLVSQEAADLLEVLTVAHEVPPPRATVRREEEEEETSACAASFVGLIVLLFSCGLVLALERAAAS